MLPLVSMKLLSTLTIVDCDVFDISPLSTLQKLTRLDLSCNSITDISPLSSLRRLTVLKLEGVHVMDFRPLKCLTQLSYLNVNMDQELIESLSVPRVELIMASAVTEEGIAKVKDSACKMLIRADVKVA
ncbi:hypothetical protein RCL1_003428 [Eukaryota sp. TZLM3-RCL]